MIDINDNNNMCKTALKYKQRRYEPKQLSLFFDRYIGSHNIYFTNLCKSSNTLQKLEETKRTVRFNKLGSLKILTVQLNKIKSYYKDITGTYIELYGVDKPIALRESLAEIKNIINRSKKW